MVDPQAARSNRRALVLLFVLFFGAMLAAGLLRFSGWRPASMKNKGEMLQPYGDLRAYQPRLAGGGGYDWHASPRTWRIVVAPRDCAGAGAAACTRLLGQLDTVWRLTGRDADRVHVLWAGDLPAGARPPRVLRQVVVEPALVAQLPRLDAPPGNAAWLVDPNGFVILRYAPGFDPGDLRTDLARLLKIN